MKKSLISLSILAAASGATHAQSSVTVYGRIDLGLVLDSGNPAGKSVRISSGAASSSRLGFMGSEDLGGGYKAGFQLETGYCADSAAGAPNYCGASNNFMSRQAHGDLSGPFGAMTAGRQYSLGFDDMIAIDPFSTGYAGRINNIVDTSGTRLNNSFRYTTPSFAGFKAAGEFALGEQSGNWASNREVGAELGYAAGPAYASFAYYDVRNANGDGSARRNYQFGGTYDFGVAKVAAMVQKGDGDPTGAIKIDTLDFMGGATVPLAGGSLLASFIHHDDRGRLNHDANQIGAGYNYPLSKRTSVYTAYARIVNRNGAAFTVGNSTETGVGNKSFNLGVLHKF